MTRPTGGVGVRGRGGWLGAAARGRGPGEFVARFQQTSPPVMAKGVEDTAFYRYVRLLALNDVGGDPGASGSRSRLPRRQRRRAARFRGGCS